MKIYFFMCGCIIGSFLNVLVSRSIAKENFICGRSHCEFCYRTLSWYELIPVFSYLFLLGRCRTCQIKLPFYLFWYELAAGIVLINFTWSQALFLITLQIISLFDLFSFEFPGFYLLPLFTFAFLNNQISSLGLGLTLLVYLILTIANHFLKFIGNGDLDVFLAIVINFDPLILTKTVLIASIFALISCIIKRIKVIPLVPYLYFGLLANLLINKWIIFFN
ncbi:prepilin peptidase [Fructilactobacillus vespulae]|uniref:prepilin peptidase n=1 Tax=Fructilactobacillus vespulae TaxID=1249630 RepID=UPI0039B516B2